MNKTTPEAVEEIFKRFKIDRCYIPQSTDDWSSWWERNGFRLRSMPLTIKQYVKVGFAAGLTVSLVKMVQAKKKVMEEKENGKVSTHHGDDY